ncbi:inositol-3-phosphate synthase [Aestuariivirga litoralis]|uniref:inositol-3-phosphate synthase n=1 Tax=Aestuariivirga litoralis TaxID=2650924 RepID=UPI0018C46A64|nr:inositol-3-phosphate synthase [Aestuariivirga litoralis]
MIKTAIIGLGNCASALVQGVYYCRKEADPIGLPFPVLGGYGAGEIEIVAGFDIDQRKVGHDLNEAIFQPPNCTYVFQRDLPPSNIKVARGPTLDGLSSSMQTHGEGRRFVESDAPELSEQDVVALLQQAGCEVVINFLPVGSQKATEFYASCALKAGCAFVNSIPVFLASNAGWAKRFDDAGLPLLGDDFKAQIGATVLHRTLASLFDLRDAELDRTYQLNIGGNTDFLNMANSARLDSKRKSKTESVQSSVNDRLADDNVRIGPSDYVPWLNDQKVGYIRLEGRIFGGAPVSIETRLTVEDSPNAAAMAISAIRCARIARDRGLKGAIWQASAFLFKHPPQQMADTVAYQSLLDFAATPSAHG